MNKKILIITLLLSLAVFITPVKATYVNGKMLSDNCNSDQPEGLFSCTNYIAGVIDYHTFMQSMGTESEATFCLPKDVTIEEASVVVIRYLKAMPDQEAFIAASTVVMALQTAYPCAK